MKKLLILILPFVLQAATCRKTTKPTIVIDSYIPQFAYGPNTLIKYRGHSYDGKELELKIRLRNFGDSCFFDYNITNEYGKSGSVKIPGNELKTAIVHQSFAEGDVTLKDETQMWMSQNSFNELKEKGNTRIVPFYKDTVTLVFKAKETYATTVDGVQKNLSCLRAEGYSKGKKKSYLILDDQRFPLIISMETGWKMTLGSITHLPRTPMVLQTALFEFKPGVKLIYSLEILGCQKDIAFEMLKMTADSVTFRYENYEYECLYNDEDEEFSGTFTMSRKIWENPGDFQLYDLTETANEAPVYYGQPFFMHPASFQKLFETGMAECNISHQMFESDDEENNEADTSEIEDDKPDAFVVDKTTFLRKESDVETGFRQFTITVNNEEKRILAVDAVADLVGTEKKMYLYPTAQWPLILYHYDDFLNMEWRLVAVEF